MYRIAQLKRDYLLNATQLFDLKKLAFFCAGPQLMGAFISLVCAIFFPGSKSAAINCGILAVIISLLPLFYAVANKKIYLLFSCVAAFNIAPIWFIYLEAVLPGYDAYVYSPPYYRLLVFFWALLFQFFFNVFYTFFWKSQSLLSIKSFSFLQSSKFKPAFYIKAALISFILPLMLFYFYYGSAGTLWTAMTAGRSEGGAGGTGLLVRTAVGGLGSLMLPVSWLWQLTPLLGTSALLSKGPKNKLLSIVVFLMGLFVIFVFFLSGSRGILIFVAAPVIFFFFYYKRNKGIKFWLITSALLFLVIGIMELQERFRGNLLDVIVDPGKAAKAKGYLSVTTFDPFKSHRDNNTYLLSLIVKEYPDRSKFEGFNEFFAVILNPIPRVIWPDKPLLIGAEDLSHQPRYIENGPVNMGTTSLSFSIVGDAYKAAGIWGILIYAMVYSLIFVFLDGIIFYLNKDKPLSIGVLGICIFLAFWGYRAFFALVSFLYPLLLLILLIKILKRRRLQ